jgi:hypothetical protein
LITCQTIHSLELWNIKVKEILYSMFFRNVGAVLSFSRYGGMTIPCKYCVCRIVCNSKEINISLHTYGVCMIVIYLFLISKEALL